MARTRHDRAVDSVLAEQLERLAAAQSAHSAAGEALETAKAARDAAIRDATAAGLSLRQIGGALGLSAEGVRAALPRQVPIYDRIGTTYSTTRREDPRIRDAIWAAIGDAGSVVNVGAGTGSYEPPQTMLAIEPSMVMIAQRPPGAAPAAVTTSERIPLPDQSVDVALSILSIHHWPNAEAGVAEMRRVARRVVIFTWDHDLTSQFWLSSEYFPEIVAFDATRAVAVRDIVRWIGSASVEPVPVPHDCIDGFLGAYWRRPEAYLDPVVRAGMSVFPPLPSEVVERGVTRLAADIESGAWAKRHADLLAKDSLDIGYRLIVGA